MSRLALYLLGPPRIERDGQPVDVRRRKAVALLTYLAVTGQSHSRDALATLFWPEHDQSRARAGLRRTLASLKKGLGEGWLEVDRENVELNSDTALWLDVQAFRERLAACGTHGHPAQEMCPDCLPLLAEAVELYRDDFLAGFTLRDSPAFDEWQFFQSQGLRADLASGLERLAREFSNQGEYQPAITYARRWLALDPLHEPAHRCLMGLYARSDQRAAALRQYQECERILQEELGVPPDEQTARLYQAIKDHREGTPAESRPERYRLERKLSGKGSFGDLWLATVGNLPLQLTPFVGREEELAQIQEGLRDPACRLLTLVGLGGSGKTRLALEAAAPQIDHYPNGIYFVSLAPLDSVDSIVPTVAEALGFHFYAEGEPRQQLLDYLRQKRMLILLDNFEHLVEGAGLVTDILQTAREVKILVTSRVRLNVGVEHLFPVAGMHFPERESDEDVDQYTAVKLFLQSASRVRPSFEPTADEMLDVARICRLLEGMPLAILLATGWMEMLTPCEIVAEMRLSLDFLKTDLRDVPARQRSMRAIFDHTWDLLPEREQELFAGLSVFRGGFTREAAQEVIGVSLHELMALINKSLLHRTSRGRYEVHDLLRGYAAEKLETSGEADAVRDAYCAYYAGFLHQREADLKGRRQLGALDEIEADFENVRAAWNWALEQKNYTVIGRLVRSLGWFCKFRSRHQEHEELLQRAREQLAPGPDDEPHPVWGRILIAEYYARPHEVDRSQVERGLAILQKHGDDLETISWGLQALGEAALDAEDYAGGLSLFEKSLAFCRELNDSFHIAGALYRLAETYRLLEQPERAVTCARQSLDLSREIGDRYWAASSLANTGVIALYTGNYTEAEGYLREANTLYREIGYRPGIAESCVQVGRLAFIRGNFEKAGAVAGEALGIATDLGIKRVAQSALDLEALVARTLGEKKDGHRVEQEPVRIPDIPTKIDQYKVKRLLGVGRFTTVYRAYDPNSEGDVVLVIASPEALEQFDWFSKGFKRAAEFAAKATHSAIPEVYDYVETAEQAYIVVEYIPGKDLEFILEEQDGFLPEKDVVEWVIQVCDALSYMHRQRPEPLIFRDIKPSNVMVDPLGRVCLVWFYQMEPYHAGREQAAGGIEGYSPPEQYFGYTDARSDVYAVGATLHHLLTCRDPREETPFSFHDAPPRSLNPAISEELEAVILRAVEHNPEDRYQGVQELKTALLACL
jgi:predicted ATPase/DNA-binding SARP family transcriptional activator